MVGPNKQFDQEETLSIALQVFWNKGYEATSMQDLVSSMGINRASMYQTYGNKYALFMSSLDMYMDN
ncbi:MAG: TetR/AcrR family transcriptional regulator, partial [Gammaproteobacteria bacterium]